MMHHQDWSEEGAMAAATDLCDTPGMEIHVSRAATGKYYVHDVDSAPSYTWLVCKVHAPEMVTPDHDAWPWDEAYGDPFAPDDATEYELNELCGEDEG